MDYTIEFSYIFEKSMKKLKKKNKPLFNQIQRKLLEIIENPENIIAAGYTSLNEDSASLYRYKLKPYYGCAKAQGI